MRQFLAVTLPPRLVEVLAEAPRTVGAGLAGWRWSRPEGVHLTLRFLGDVAEEVDRRSRDRWREVVGQHAPSSFEPAVVGCFPDRGPPRVLWVGVREQPAGALAELARSLETAARRLGFTAERRPFRPHLTLARASRGGVADRPSGPIALPSVPVAVDAVTLYRSELHPAGARYTALERFPLHGD